MGSPGGRVRSADGIQSLFDQRHAYHYTDNIHAAPYLSGAGVLYRYNARRLDTRAIVDHCRAGFSEFIFVRKCRTEGIHDSAPENNRSRHEGVHDVCRGSNHGTGNCSQSSYCHHCNRHNGNNAPTYTGIGHGPQTATRLSHRNIHEWYDLDGRDAMFNLRIQRDV